jgi:probable F420-dependent oxidoreductase
MDIGVVFPHLEMGKDPIVLRDWAQTAEGLGYSHILLNDHVLGAVHEGRTPALTGPYTDQDQFHEPLTLSAYYSGTTSRIGFVTGVLILPQRQTVLVAKQAAEIAILSGNRFRLGVGVGWNYVEYEALGADFKTRGKRQEEQIELLRRLWGEPLIDFAGRWHRVDRGGILPMPDRTIPIWFGGFGAIAFARAAKMGDGFLLTRLLHDSVDGKLASEPIENLLHAARMLRALVAAEGRAPESFEVEGRMNYVDGADSWGKEVETFRGAGFERIAMQPLTAGISSPAAHIEALRTFAREIGLTSS